MLGAADSKDCHTRKKHEYGNSEIDFHPITDANNSWIFLVLHFFYRGIIPGGAGGAIAPP